MQKNIRTFMFFFFLIMLLIALPILSSIVKEIVEVHELNFTLIPSSIVVDASTRIDTYKDFYTTKHPLHVFGWGVIVFYLISSLLGRATRVTSSNKYMQKDSYGSHGTSRFQIKKEIKNNYYKDQLGWFLGTVEKEQIYKLGISGAYHKLNGELNSQLLVVGSPGSRKTTGFIYPNIFHLPYIYKKVDNGEMPDLLITDPKSEIWSITSKYLEEQGYDVRVLDFIHLKYGDMINPLDLIETEKELMEIADGYIKSVGASTGSNSKDGFWTEQEGQALASLLGAVKQYYPEGHQTMDKVLELLTNKFVKDDGSIDMVKAREFFIEYVKGSALQLWKNFLLLSKSENTAGNILGGLVGKLKLFTIEDIRNLTSRSTINIKKLGAKKEDGEKPIALFVFMPDGDKTFSPIINVVVTSIFKQAYKTAYKYNNRLANPLFVMIEEMANIGVISDLDTMLGTMRGRRIYPMMILQDLIQLRDMYGQTWEKIVAKCDTQVYLGVNDDFTAKYVSNLLGNTTIKTQGVSSTPKGFGVESQSESQNYGQRKLMFPEEVKSLNNSKMIVSQRAFFPTLLEKVQYKYWEEESLISKPKEINELLLINRFSEENNKTEDTTVNTITVIENIMEHQKDNIDKDVDNTSFSEDKVTEHEEAYIEEVATTKEVEKAKNSDNDSPFNDVKNENEPEYNPFGR